jgi:hypothetical protein
MKGLVLISIAVLAMALSGCLSQNAGIPQTNVVEADEKMVADCQFLGNVQGVAMWANGPQHEVKRAIGDAKKEAEKLGATHIILGEPQVAGRSRQISGRAYRCQDKPPNGR